MRPQEQRWEEYRDVLLLTLGKQTFWRQKVLTKKIAKLFRVLFLGRRLFFNHLISYAYSQLNLYSS